MSTSLVAAVAALTGFIALTASAKAAAFDALARSTPSRDFDLSAVTEVNETLRKHSRASNSRAWRDRRNRLHRRHLYRPYFLDSPYYYSTSFDGYPYVSRRGNPFRSWNRGAIHFR